MLPPGAHLDPRYVDHHHLFPGHGHGHFNSETLEAVLMRPTRAGSAAPECEAAAVTAPQAQGGRRNVVPAAAAGQGQGHARARKRPFRTDRHSKIRTAQGVRDRRMRLSLDVARDFFALQDRLGFDKPSKTVDWLLTQSKTAIERLAAAAEPSQRSDDAAALSPPTSGAAAAGGSGKRGGVAEKLGSRSGGSASMEMDQHTCELDRLVSAAPVLREYYYGLSEMMSNDNNGGDGDDDGEYEEEDGDFLDGMQY